MMKDELRQSKVLVIGCGRMGGAIIKGWCNGLVAPDNITIVDPTPFPDLVAGVKQVSGPEEITDDFFDVVMLAVKPQIFPKIMSLYAPFISDKTLILSIMAGVETQAIEAMTDSKQAVIRVMPNTPALVGAGVMVCFSNAVATPQNEALCDTLFSPLGSVHWVHDESDMHAVTAISGSGPAYLFYFAECMVAAAKNTLKDEVLAAKLAKETLYGAALLMQKEAREPMALRQEVTSPNGTTQAALEVLMSDGVLDALANNALQAASKRSLELSALETA